jgi:hypothetical protein
MKTALSNWHREMISLGLASENDETFQSFIWTEPEGPTDGEKK